MPCPLTKRASSEECDYVGDVVGLAEPSQGGFAYPEIRRRLVG
jgi:hypothetical protein